MSYLVFARKYRPMFFEDVVGQQHVTRTLQNAIEQNRVANAYLFSGPRGVGKTTIARILSKALNCDKGPTIKPCDKCSSCIEINESRSFDVFEIDGASNRGIDEVRNLRESLRYSPTPGKHRIYIIDEVHMLTNEAFNALLKTLEEPPKNVLFIFATTEAHKVPATILSRCQRFNFKRLSTKLIIQQLQILCEKENIQADAESLRLIATKADGGMRDAQSILDQIIAFTGNSILAKNVTELLGIIDNELFFRMTDLIKADDIEGAIHLANSIFVEGLDFSEFLSGLSGHFRNLLVAKTTNSTGELDVSEEHAKKYMDECPYFQIEDLLRYIKIAADADNFLKRSSNARLHLEVTLIKLVKLAKSVQLSQLMDQFSDIKKKPEHVAAAPLIPPAPSFLPQQSLKNAHAEEINTENQANLQVHKIDSQEIKPEITIQNVEDHWQELLETIKTRKIALGSFLSEGWPTKLDGNTLEITFGANNGFHISSIEKSREFIQEMLRKVFGVRLKFKCNKDTEGLLEKVRKFPARVDKNQNFQNLLQENKIIQSIVDTFDAELVQ